MVIRRPLKERIKPQAIAGWQACDYLALQIALGLTPYSAASPLPLEITPLGVSERCRPPRKSKLLWDRYRAADFDADALPA